MIRATLRTTRAALLLAVVAASLSSAAFAQADQHNWSTPPRSPRRLLERPRRLHWLRNNINRAKQS